MSTAKPKLPVHLVQDYILAAMYASSSPATSKQILQAVRWDIREAGFSISMNDFVAALAWLCNQKMVEPGDYTQDDYLLFSLTEYGHAAWAVNGGFTDDPQFVQDIIAAYQNSILRHY